MFCLLQVVAIAREKIASQFTDRLDWIKVHVCLIACDRNNTIPKRVGVHLELASDSLSAALPAWEKLKSESKKELQ